MSAGADGRGSRDLGLEVRAGSSRAFVRVAIHLSIVLSILIGISVALPEDSFWITDNGNRWIQTQSMAHGGGDSWIHVPAREIDPDLRFFPRGGHHFFIRDGNVGSFYGTTFPVLSAMLSSVFGDSVRVVIPLLGTLLILAVSAAISRRFGVDPVASVWLVAFATPVVFYSMTFWEHTLATGLALTALWLSWRRDLLAMVVAGAVLALSITLREEGYLFGAAIVLAMLLERRWMKVASFLFGLLTVLSIHLQMLYSTYGSVLGPHISSYLEMENDRPLVLNKIIDYWVYLFQAHSDPVVTALAALPQLAALAALLFLGKRRGVARFLTVLLVAVVLSGLWFATTVLGDPAPDLGTLDRQGLLPGLPLVIPAILGALLVVRSPRKDRASTGFVFLGVLIATPLFLHTADIGIIWGPRHFFHLFPLVVILALAGFKWLGTRNDHGSRRLLFRIAAIGLVGASVLLQIGGLRTLIHKRVGSSLVVEAVKELDQAVVVTDVYWLPEEIGAIFYDRIVLETRSSADFVTLVRRLREKGLTSFAFVTIPEYGVVKREILLPLAVRIRSRSIAILGTIELVTIECDSSRIAMRPPVPEPPDLRE